MKYNLALPIDCARADARYECLKKKGAVIDITDKSSRSKAQNSYEHLLMGIVAMDIGITLDECKEFYFKRLVNPDIFVIRKALPLLGEITSTRSTKDINADETSIAIDRFKRWMVEQGYYVPDPLDEQRLLDIEIEMDRMESFIGR